MTESEGSQEHYLFENLLHDDTFIRHMYLYLKLTYRSCTFLSVLQIGPHANIMTKPSNQSSNNINGITSTLTPYASSKHHVKNLHSKHISTILSKYVWRHKFYIPFLQLSILSMFKQIWNKALMHRLFILLYQYK